MTSSNLRFGYAELTFDFVESSIWLRRIFDLATIGNLHPEQGIAAGGLLQNGEVGGNGFYEF